MEDKRALFSNIANKKTSLTKEQIESKRAMVLNNNSNRERKFKTDSSKLSGQALEMDIYTSEITANEMQKRMSNMQLVKEIRRLQKMEAMGFKLSKEQKIFLENNRELLERMQIDYQNRQEQRKHQGHGMEM